MTDGSDFTGERDSIDWFIEPHFDSRGNTMQQLRCLSLRENEKIREMLARENFDLKLQLHQVAKQTGDEDDLLSETEAKELTTLRKELEENNKKLSENQSLLQDALNTINHMRKELKNSEIKYENLLAQYERRKVSVQQSSLDLIPSTNQHEVDPQSLVPTEQEESFFPLLKTTPPRNDTNINYEHEVPFTHSAKEAFVSQLLAAVDDLQKKLDISDKPIRYAMKKDSQAEIDDLKRRSNYIPLKNERGREPDTYLSKEQPTSELSVNTSHNSSSMFNTPSGRNLYSSQITIPKPTLNQPERIMSQLYKGPSQAKIQTDSTLDYCTPTSVASENTRTPSLSQHTLSYGSRPSMPHFLSNQSTKIGSLSLPLHSRTTSASHTSSTPCHSFHQPVFTGLEKELLVRMLNQE